MFLGHRGSSERDIGVGDLLETLAAAVFERFRPILESAADRSRGPTATTFRWIWC